jgi:hypothetical protein
VQARFGELDRVLVWSDHVVEALRVSTKPPPSQLHRGEVRAVDDNARAGPKQRT